MAKLVQNVSDFIGRAAELHGRSESLRFEQEMYYNCTELGMESPIEHLFWVACYVMAAAVGEKINPEPCGDGLGNYFRDGTWEWHGLFIKPQAQIGKYRVDFLLSQSGIAPEDVYTPVVVELDGHEFHDKNKQQRSYEKARDRELTKRKYKVFHYTGGDVVKDPLRVAHEALREIGLLVGTGMDEYHADDPLDLGG